MENSLMNLSDGAIEVVQGKVLFNDYERIKNEALDLAEQIETVEVTEENLKQSKKLLATVNKRCKELDNERIAIKKMMLEPYQDFEDKVKEILGIVKNSDATVRQQVKDMEEAERAAKQEQIAEIFYKRKKLYTLGDLIPFEDFLQPKHLNKTTTIEAVEKEMVDFLERTEKDVKVMKSLPDINAHVSAYLKCYDLALAITSVNRENERKRQIEASEAVKKNAVTIKTFTVYDEKDFLLVEMYMKNNRIKFTVKDENR